jgi:hypothetical protein
MPRPYLDVRRCGQRATHASPLRSRFAVRLRGNLHVKSGGLINKAPGGVHPRGDSQSKSAQARWRVLSCVGRSRSNSFAHKRKASAACWISCSLCARSSRCSTSSRASTPGRASCSRNSAIASATERMVRPSRMWSSRWNRSLAGFLMHALTSDRHIGSGWSAVQQAPQYLPLKGQRYRIWVVVPAKRARLNRARASRDPVTHGPRECTNRVDYWIPALARRAKARLARPE